MDKIRVHQQMWHRWGLRLRRLRSKDQLIDLMRRDSEMKVMRWGLE